MLCMFLGALLSFSLLNGFIRRMWVESLIHKVVMLKNGSILCDLIQLKLEMLLYKWDSSVLTRNSSLSNHRVRISTSNVLIKSLFGSNFES